MRVLLLGGTGNLGSRYIPALLAHGHIVTVYVRSPSKLRSMMSPAVIERLESIVVGDATDSTTIAKAIRDHDIEVIIDVAGNQVLPWREYLLPKIARAVSDAAISVGKERGAPLRVWITSGLGILKIRETSCLAQELSPYIAMAQHDHTRKVVEPIPLAELRWSLLAVGIMNPLDPEQTVFELLGVPLAHDLLLASTSFPAWEYSWWINVPLIGKYINMWVVVLSQYTTKLEAVADFMAEDLEKGDEEFIGSKVGTKEKAKDKSAWG